MVLANSPKPLKRRKKNKAVKIGILSDLHADLKMTRRALAVLEDQTVNLVVCAGDLVYRGEDGDAVVALIRERAIPCVQGNHDADAADTQDWLLQRADLSALHSQLLNAASLQFLADLPATLRFEWEGVRVLLAHGTPENKFETLFPESPTARFQRLAADSSADVIIGGHTHQAMQVRAGGVWFLNPGSVWHNRFGNVKQTCAVLTLPEIDFQLFDVKTGFPIALEATELD